MTVRAPSLGGRRLLGLLGVVALTAIVMGVGRVEARRDREARVAGMRAVLAITGRDLHENLVGYRFAETVNCLLYSPAGRPLGVELCFDGSGRLVEAIDRYPDETRIWSFRARPDRSPFVFPIPLLLERFGEFDAFEDVPRGAAEIPTGYSDLGPYVPPE